MNNGPTLSLGSHGHDVRRFQRILVMMKSLYYTEITGSFNSVTEKSVKDFQGGNGLVADGVVGPATWAALPPDPDTPKLSHGSSGNIVKSLQKGLKLYSGQNPAVDPGAIDGIFGNRTESAVRAYQGDRGVTVDGRVGDQTWWVPAGAAGAVLSSLSGLTTI
jgi:peptidoglycan hydrolase-like protein with peptidoglycan-binding domain